ncbi:MAG: DUF892 family protein [Proteobacteria bacterium]|nr:MAG: DUF892 family protein [Pseudomonadota bacterium]
MTKPISIPSPVAITPDSALGLFLGQLHDLYRAETQLGVSLETLATLANHRSLRHMIVKHLAEIDLQKERIVSIFRSYGITAPLIGNNERLPLIEMDQDRLTAAPSLETRDVLLIVQCMKIDQYEIAAYETTARLAEQLGLITEAEILAECLAERDSSAEILRKLQAEILRLAFPTEIDPDPIFHD